MYALAAGLPFTSRFLPPRFELAFRAFARRFFGAPAAARFFFPPAFRRRPREEDARAVPSAPRMVACWVGVIWPTPWNSGMAMVGGLPQVGGHAARDDAELQAQLSFGKRFRRFCGGGYLGTLPAISRSLELLNAF